MVTMDDFAYANWVSSYPMVMPTGEPGVYDLEIVHDMYRTLRIDRAETYDACHRYLLGDHTRPYAPRDTTAQVRDLQKRSITNWCPLLVNLPSQVSYMDGYRRGSFDQAVQKDAPPGQDAQRFSPEYEVWQRNGMDAKQALIYRAALTYGQNFVYVDNRDPDPKKIRLDVLSTRNTVAYFHDVVNDITPAIVLTIKSYPRNEDFPGVAIVWDSINRYELEFAFGGDFVMKRAIPHGLGRTPVVRYVCTLDDDGQVSGVITKTLIALQDRINQATFSTNITADFGAFKVRTAAGLQVQFKLDANGEPLLGADGRPIPEPIEVTQAKLLVSGNPDTKFGQLDETPLNGYLLAEDQATKNLAAIAQFPMHALLGSGVANLSAEALNALEAQFHRFLHQLHTTWGESHEELFRLISLAAGDQEGAESFGGEVRWRDMDSKAFSQVMDGLSKGVTALGVPKRAAWAMIPGVTSGTLQDWEALHKEEETDAMFNQMNNPAQVSRTMPSDRPAVAKTPAPATTGQPKSGNA